MDFSDASCVLKVNMHCDACKMQMMEVLGSIIGVYSVTVDAPRGLVKISGEVDPDMVLTALAKTGKHAELVWSKINHPQVNRTRHNDLNNSLYNYNRLGNYAMGDPNYGNYPYLPYGRGYGGNRPLPAYSRHHPFGDSLERNAPYLGYYY